MHEQVVNKRWIIQNSVVPAWRQWKWKWNLMEVSQSQSGVHTKKNKLPNHFAVRTSECSWRATVAPAGWASSGLRAPHTGGGAGGPDGTCRGHWLIPLLKKTRFVHVILAMLFFSVSLQAKTPRNYVRRPCAGPLKGTGDWSEPAIVLLGPRRNQGWWSLSARDIALRAKGEQPLASPTSTVMDGVGRPKQLLGRW